MPLEVRSLREIAEDSAFAPADVAFLAGVNEATVSRLWDASDWLDRVKGSTLQALIAVVPGLGAYVLANSLAVRRHQLFESLHELGATVDVDRFEELVTVRQVPEQHVANALTAMTYVLKGDDQQAAAHLARFWGMVQDQALGYVYAARDDGGILADRSTLVEASAAVAERLAPESRSFHATVAQANLAHQVARATGHVSGALGRAPTTRQAALAYRSAVMGSIIETNDLDLAERYCRMVDDDPVLALIEAWAFPTYARDCRPAPDLSVPRALILKNTAHEILREVATYNDAYFHYLMKTGIPAVLSRDPTFGLRGDDLKEAVETRLASRPSRRTPTEIVDLEQTA